MALANARTDISRGGLTEERSEISYNGIFIENLNSFFILTSNRPRRFLAEAFSAHHPPLDFGRAIQSDDFPN
jgi:hypothetical protein